MAKRATKENYLRMTHEAGCPDEQAKQLYRLGYRPLPWAMRFHAAARLADRADGPTEIAMGGARGPGKSYSSLAQVGLDDCQRRDGLRCLFLRKIAKSAKESFENMVNKLFIKVPHIYKTSQNLLVFTNNSSIRMGGYNSEGDIDSYLGIEYDVITVEEATALSLNKKLMLQGSLRTSRRDWRPRMYLTTNPGNVGHAWFKQAYVIPYRNKAEKNTRFIPATYRDNPFLNKEYIDYLLKLPGALGRAWRDGDWDSFEGMAFPLWDDTRHVVEPFEIPAHWLRIRGIDWGYAKPWCCLWVAINPDNGRVVVYREAYEANLTDRQQAEKINLLTPEYEDIRESFADPSMWAKKTQENVTSTEEVYRRHGVTLTRADNDRLSGKRKVDRLLADLPDGEPGLLIFSTCKNLRRTLPELVYDETHVEDVNTDGEDHAYDALKYALTTVRDGAKKTTPAVIGRDPWAARRDERRRRA